MPSKRRRPATPLRNSDENRRQSQASHSDASVGSSLGANAGQSVLDEAERQFARFAPPLEPHEPVPFRRRATSRLTTAPQPMQSGGPSSDPAPMSSPYRSSGSPAAYLDSRRHGVRYDSPGSFSHKSFAAQGSARATWGLHIAQQSREEVVEDRRRAPSPSDQLVPSMAIVGVTEPRPTFEDLGIRSEVAEALARGMPDVTAPTYAQRSLISHITKSDRDVLMRDQTGGGKSLALLLSLLSLPPVTWPDGLSAFRPAAVLVVYTNILAQQYARWLAELFPNDTERDAIARVVTFSHGEPSVSYEALEQAGPLLIICTPRGIKWLTDQTESTLLDGMRVLAVDEADAILDVATTDKPKSYRSQSPLRHAVDAIWQKRHHLALERPRLVMTTASAKAGFRDFLVGQSGWLADPATSLAWLDFSQYTLQEALNSQNAEPSTMQGQLMRPGTMHHCLVVRSDSSSYDILADPSCFLSADEAARRHDDGRLDDPPPGSLLPGAKFERGQRRVSWLFEHDEAQSFLWNYKAEGDVAMINALAAAYGDLEPPLAITFFTNGTTLALVARQLEKFGIRCVVLDERTSEEERRWDGRPLLYLAHERSARGLDLVGLTHVFIAFMPISASSYLHMAGRVGRLLNSGGELSKGTVTTLVRESEGWDQHWQKTGILQALSRLGVRLASWQTAEEARQIADARPGGRD